MVYEKNKVNETGVWIIVLSGVIFGSILFFTEPGTFGKSVGATIFLGGIYLAFELLFFSVQKVTTYNDRLKLNYFLRKKYIHYSMIRDVKLEQQTHVSKVSTREIEVIDIYLYTNQKIRLGGNFGGFFKHSTKKLYNELCKSMHKNF